MPSATSWFLAAMTVCGIQGFAISTNQKNSNIFSSRLTGLDTQQRLEGGQGQNDQKSSANFGSTTKDMVAGGDEGGHEVTLADDWTLNTADGKQEQASLTNRTQDEASTEKEQSSKLSDFHVAEKGAAQTTTDHGAASTSSNKSSNTQPTPGLTASVPFSSSSQKNPTTDSSQFPQLMHGNYPGHVDKGVDELEFESLAGKNDAPHKERGNISSNNHQPEIINTRENRWHEITNPPKSHQREITFALKKDKHVSQIKEQTNNSNDQTAVVGTTSVSPDPKLADPRRPNSYHLEATNKSDVLKHNNTFEAVGVTLFNSEANDRAYNVNLDGQGSQRNSGNSAASVRSIDNRQETTSENTDQRKDIGTVASKSIPGTETYGKTVKPENTKKSADESDLQQTVLSHVADIGPNPVHVSLSKVQENLDTRRIQPVDLYGWPKRTPNSPSVPVPANRGAFTDTTGVTGSGRHPSVFVPIQPKRPARHRAETFKQTFEINKNAMSHEEIPPSPSDIHSEHELIMENYTDVNNSSMVDKTSTNSKKRTPQSVPDMNESKDELAHDNILKSSDNSSSSTGGPVQSIKDHDIFYQMTPIEYRGAQKDDTQKQTPGPNTTSSFSNDSSPHNRTKNEDYEVREKQSSITAKEASLGEQPGNQSTQIMNDNGRLIFSEFDAPSKSNNETEAFSKPVLSMPSRTKPDSRSHQNLSKKSQGPIPAKFSAKNVPNRSKATQANNDINEYAGQQRQIGIIEEQAISSHDLQPVKKPDAGLDKFNTVIQSPYQSAEDIAVTNKTESTAHSQIKSSSYPQKSPVQVLENHDRGNSPIQISGQTKGGRNVAQSQQDIQEPYQDRPQHYRYAFPYYSLVKRRGQLSAEQTNVLPTRSSQRPATKTSAIPNSSLSTRKLNNDNYSRFKKQISDNSRLTPRFQTAKLYPKLEAYSLVHDIAKSANSDNQKTDQIHPSKNVNTHQSTATPSVWYDRVLGLRLGGSHPSQNPQESLKMKQISTRQNQGKMAHAYTRPLKDGSGKLTHSEKKTVKNDETAKAPQNPHGVFSRDQQQAPKAPQSPHSVFSRDQKKAPKAPQNPHGVFSRDQQQAPKAPQNPHGVFSRDQQQAPKAPQRPYGVFSRDQKKAPKSPQNPDGVFSGDQKKAPISPQDSHGVFSRDQQQAPKAPQNPQTVFSRDQQQAPKSPQNPHTVFPRDQKKAPNYRQNPHAMFSRDRQQASKTPQNPRAVFSRNQQQASKVPQNPRAIFSQDQQQKAKAPKNPQVVFSRDQQQAPKSPQNQHAVFSRDRQQATKTPQNPQAVFSRDQQQKAKAPKNPHAVFSRDRQQATKTPQNPRAVFLRDQQRKAKAPKNPHAVFSRDRQQASKAPQNPRAVFSRDQQQAPKSPQNPHAVFSRDQQQEAKAPKNPHAVFSRNQQLKAKAPKNPHAVFSRNQHQVAKSAQKPHDVFSRDQQKAAKSPQNPRGVFSQDQQQTTKAPRNPHGTFPLNQNHLIKTADTVVLLSRKNSTKDSSTMNKPQDTVVSRPNQSHSGVQDKSKVHKDKRIVPGDHFPRKSFQFQPSPGAPNSFQRKEYEKPFNMKSSKTNQSVLKPKVKEENVRLSQASKSTLHGGVETVKIPPQNSKQTGKQILSNGVPKNTIQDSEIESFINNKRNGVNRYDDTVTSKPESIFPNEKSTPEGAYTRPGRELASHDKKRAHHQSERTTTPQVPTESHNPFTTTNKREPPVASQRSVNNPRRIVYSDKVRSPASIYGEDSSSLHPTTFHSLGSLHSGGEKSNFRRRENISYKNGRSDPRLPPQQTPGTSRLKSYVQNNQKGTTNRPNTLRPNVRHHLYKDSDTINPKGRDDLLHNVDTRETTNENSTTFNNSSSYETDIYNILSALSDIYNGFPGYGGLPLPLQPLYPYANPYAYPNPYLHPIARQSPYVLPSFHSAHSQSPSSDISLLHSILNAGTPSADGTSLSDQNVFPSWLNQKGSSLTGGNGEKPSTDRQSRKPTTSNNAKDRNTENTPSLLSKPFTKIPPNAHKVADLRHQSGINTPVNRQARWYQPTQKYPATKHQQPWVDFNSKTGYLKNPNSFQQPPILAPPAFSPPTGWLPMYPPLYIVDPRQLYGPPHYLNIPPLYSSKITPGPQVHQIDERDLSAVEHFLLTRRGYKSWGGSNSKPGQPTNPHSYMTNAGIHPGHLTDMDMKAIEHFIYTKPYNRKGTKKGGLGSLGLASVLG